MNLTLPDPLVTLLVAVTATGPHEPLKLTLDVHLLLHDLVSQLLQAKWLCSAESVEQQCHGIGCGIDTGEGLKVRAPRPHAVRRGDSANSSTVGQTALVQD